MPCALVEIAELDLFGAQNPQQRAQLLPEPFDKYLYVGTTRAATYLGMSYQKSLPAALDPLQAMFVVRW